MMQSVLESPQRWNFSDMDVIVLDRGTTWVPTRFGPAHDATGRNCFFSVFVPLHKDKCDSLPNYLSETINESEESLLIS